MTHNSTSGFIPKRTRSRDSNSYLHTHVHSSTMHNGQKVEATQVSVDRLVDKTGSIHSYNGVFFSFKKKGNMDTHNYNVDEPWECYAK